MEVNDLISMVTPEIYQRLSTAVELGKWPDGVALTAEQKEHCMPVSYTHLTLPTSDLV